MPTLDHAALALKLRILQADIRASLRAHMRSQEPAVWSRTVRDDSGDTIFGIDAKVEDILVQHCQEWGRKQHFILVAEGLEPGGIQFGQPGLGGPPFRLLVDPIDGTRGLMFDKRSAWCLMGAAPERGKDTKLQDVEVAVMTELPTTRQSTSDVLWAIAGKGVKAERHDLGTGAPRPLALVPSQATTLRHGFATVSNFFQGGKELISRLEEAIFLRALGAWNADKAEVYADQYICSGGQLAEVMLGRDRFVLDVRPLVHKKLGVKSSLACRPYDLVTWLIAKEAGCVICDPFGKPLDAPLDTTTNISFAAYANQKLADVLIPIVREEVQKHLG
ncbi:MAG: inositol monophosphatase [Planctomycetes bacterium]|nr:inositol monophosphatase [Planctomycetota bacterium]MCC7061218.1 inositol monophosphatase [Planctomycetota bacterium]